MVPHYRAVTQSILLFVRACVFHDPAPYSNSSTIHDSADIQCFSSFRVSGIRVYNLSFECQQSPLAVWSGVSVECVFSGVLSASSVGSRVCGLDI